MPWVLAGAAAFFLLPQLTGQTPAAPAPTPTTTYRPPGTTAPTGATTGAQPSTASPWLSAGIQLGTPILKSAAEGLIDWVGGLFDSAPASVDSLTAPTSFDWGLVDGGWGWETPDISIADSALDFGSWYASGGDAWGYM